MMKTTKKLLTLCLAVIVMVSACASVLATESIECKLNDGQIGLLKFLQIVPDEVPAYSSKMTRGELAYIVAKTAKVSHLVSENEISPFYDVSPEDKYFNEICALKNLGIIAGDGSGFFKPNQAAIFTDACKMFAFILGYQDNETYTYLELAKRAGVLDGVDITGGELSYGTALEMAYNVLHCFVFEPVAYGDDIRYQVNENCLGLERFHGLLELTGIVSGASGTTLTEANDLIDEDELVIGEKYYRYEGGQSLLGMYSVFYIPKSQKDEATTEIVYIYADQERNKVLTIQSDDITGFQSGTLTYDVAGKDKTIEVTGQTDVIYNDVAYPDYVDADFTTINGILTLIDNNNDRTYDVIKIESSVYAVVGGTDVNDNVIFTEYPAGGMIGDPNRTVSINYYNAGRLAYLGGLKKGDVISVKESKNTTGTKRITIKTMENVVNGKITFMDEKGISIDGKHYDISSNVVTDEPLKLGMDVAVYLDAGRCAVVLNNQTDAFSVGYMVAINTTKSAFNSKIRVLLLDYSKETNEFDCAKNLKIDGIRYTNTEAVLSCLRTSAAQTYGTSTSQWPYSQLIRYKLNDNGEITYIDTLQKNQDEDESSLELYAPGGTGAKTLMYYSTNRGFHLPTSTDVNTSQRFDFAVPSSAKVWFVPNNARMDEDWYRVGANFKHTSNYLVEAYNVGEYDRQAEYVLVYFTPTMTIDVDATPYIVREISQVLYNDELCYKIDFCGTTNTSGYIRKGLLDVEINCGDAVRFTQNYKGEIIKVEKLFAPGEDVAMSDRIISSNNSDRELLKSVRFAFGTAVAITDSSLVQTTSVTDDIGGVENYASLNNYTINAGTKVFVYDSERETVSAGSVKDIIPYSLSKTEASTIAVYTSNGNTQYIYVIK